MLWNTKEKKITPYESFHWDTTERFFHGQLGGGVSRTLKTNNSLAVMEEVKIGTSNTITSVQKDNLVIEPQDTAKSICLNCCEGGGLEPKILSEQPRYRIRKLTPRECFRLMDCDDEIIDKIQDAGISNTQQYKLAGNSIVVNVLYHLFRKMFDDELSLF